MASSPNALRAQAKVERIARIAGRTSYKSLREGFGSSLSHDTDLDIKVALGMTQRRTSHLAVRALETKYASTLMHEEFLRREYMVHLVEHVLIGKRQSEARDKHQMAVVRMGCSLALREFAGQRYVQTQLAQYAWMVMCRRTSLEDAMRTMHGWLAHHADTAEDEFLNALKERRAEIKVGI